MAPARLKVPARTGVAATASAATIAVATVAIIIRDTMGDMMRDGPLSCAADRRRMPILLMCFACPQPPHTCGLVATNRSPDARELRMGRVIKLRAPRASHGAPPHNRPRLPANPLVARQLARPDP